MGTLSTLSISTAPTAGRAPLNSSVSLSSHDHVSMVFSRSLSLTSPPPAIRGVRTLTVNERVALLPRAVSTRSSIRRRSSALTVLTDSPRASPSVTVTR